MHQYRPNALYYTKQLLSPTIESSIPSYVDADQAEGTVEKATAKAHISRTYSFKDSITSSFSNLSLRHFLIDNTAKPRMLLSRAKSSLTRIHSQLHLLPTQSNSILIPRSTTSMPRPTRLGKSDIDCSSRRWLSQNEPIVHYNGSNQTLESFTAEKLEWIRTEPANANFFIKRNPLIDYHHSVVLRKSLKQNNVDSRQHKDTLKPRAMFYLRLIQTFLIDSNKSRLLRCQVTVDNDVCNTGYVQSSKSGKNSSVAEFDQTFLFDIERPTTVTISLHAQNRKMLRRKKSYMNLNSEPQQPLLQQLDDVCLGFATIKIDMKAKAKATERIVLESNNSTGTMGSTASTCQQLLVVHGVYLSQQVQDYLCNSVLHKDYITIQARQRSSSLASYRHKRWIRFWGVLRGIQLELYDKQYKETQAALYIIPLYYFVSTLLQSDMVDQERGIVLQFTDGALNEDELLSIIEADEERKKGQFLYNCQSAPVSTIDEDLSFCVYMLADSMEAKQFWEVKMDYAGSVFDELRGWNFENDDEDDEDSQISHESICVHDNKEAAVLDCFSNSSIFEERLEGKDLTVPLDLLW